MDSIPEQISERPRQPRRPIARSNLTHHEKETGVVCDVIGKVRQSKILALLSKVEDLENGITTFAKRNQKSRMIKCGRVYFAASHNVPFRQSQSANPVRAFVLGAPTSSTSWSGKSTPAHPSG